MLYPERVRETTTTTGTGAVTLAGAVAGYVTFASMFGAAELVPYCIQAGTEWEVGEGLISGGTLVRSRVSSSSNANALVSFSAGTKAVFATYRGALAIDRGMVQAIHGGSYGR